MYLGIIVPKLLRYPHRLGYNNKMCWHLLANAARSTMRKSRISKVLPHPPFTSFTFPITPDPSRISTAQEAGSDFSCLLPASSSFVCRPFHVAFHANVAIFFCSSSSSNSKASRFLYFYNPLIGKTLNFRIRNSQSQMQMMPRPQATLLKKVTNFKSQAIW